MNVDNTDTGCGALSPTDGSESVWSLTYMKALAERMMYKNAKQRKTQRNN